MPFKLPAGPSPGATTEELADFAELLAWDVGSTSSRELVRKQNQEDDNDHNIGLEDDEVENTDATDEVFREIENRFKLLGESYPFKLVRGQKLEHLPIDEKNIGGVVYRYLLLCTRLNMAANRTHAEINGTELFEALTAVAMQNYLGSGRAKSSVFGTSVLGGFAKKVKELCVQIEEGGGYSPVDKAAKRANDGGLDVFVWMPFVDRRAGKLMLFAQSKTGTSWRGETTKSRPIDFAKTWLANRNFSVVPVRTFAVAEWIGMNEWQSIADKADLLLDRPRVVELAVDIEDDLRKRILKWTIQAKKVTPITAR